MSLFSRKNKEHNVKNGGTGNKRASFMFKKTLKPTPPPSILLFSAEPLSGGKIQNSSVRPQSQIITPGVFRSPFGVVGSNNYASAPEYPVGQGTPNNFTPVQSAVLTGNYSYSQNYVAPRPHSSMPKRRPPPKSPIKSEKAVFDSLDSGVKLTRQDSKQRRARLQSVDVLKKSLPLLPPQSSDRVSFSGRQSAYEALSGSCSSINNEPIIPKRSERRASSIASGKSLTSGLSVDNPHKIPARSIHRTSKYLPFATEEVEKRATFSVINSRKMPEALLPSEVVKQKQEILDLIKNVNANTLSSETNVDTPTTSQLNDIYDPNNMDTTYELPTEPSAFSFVAGSYPVSIPARNPSPKTVPTPAPSIEGFIPPVFEGASFDNILKDLWAPVSNKPLKGNNQSISNGSNLNQIDTINSWPPNIESSTIQPHNNVLPELQMTDIDIPTLPEYRKPDIISDLEKLDDKWGYKSNKSDSNSNNTPDDNINDISNDKLYLIDESVLNFGESLDAGDIFEQVDNRNRKQLRDKLERNATVKLRQVVTEFNNAKRYDETANIYKDLTVISNYALNNRSFSSPMDSTDSALESELQKYMLINEYLSRKNTTASNKVATPPQENLKETFESPSYINEAPDHIIRTDVSIPINEPVACENEKKYEYDSDNASTLGGSSGHEISIPVKIDNKNVSGSSTVDGENVTCPKSANFDKSDNALSWQERQVAAASISSPTYDDDYDSYSEIENHQEEEQVYEEGNFGSIKPTNYHGDVNSTGKKSNAYISTELPVRNETIRTREITPISEEQEDSYGDLSESINGGIANMSKSVNTKLCNGNENQIPNIDTNTNTNSNSNTNTDTNTDTNTNTDTDTNTNTDTDTDTNTDTDTDTNSKTNSKTNANTNAYTITNSNTNETSNASRQSLIDRTASIRTESSVFTGSSVVSPSETIAVGSIAQDFQGVEDTDSEGTINIINFSSTSLKAYHFKQCREVWSYSGVFHWLVKFERWFDNQIFRKKEMVASMELLIKYYFPKIKSGVIVELVVSLMAEYLRTGSVRERVDMAYEGNRNAAVHVNDFEDMLIIELDTSSTPPSGVLTPLLKCYGTRYNEHDVNGTSCYSLYCPYEAEKPVNIAVPEVEDPNELKRSWIQHWSISERERNGLDNHVIEQQSRIYDLIRKQYDFLVEADYLVNTIGQAFSNSSDTALYVYPHSKEQMYYAMFATVKPLIETHKECLFEPMKKVLYEQGKFIRSGIYGLYKQWTKQCFSHYIEYIDHLAETTLFLEFEKMKKHSLFREWLDTFPQQPLAPLKLLSNYFFYNLIQYKDSLRDIRKRTARDDPESERLSEAIAIITIFCDKINKRLGSADVHAIFKHFSWRVPPSNFNIEFNPGKMTLESKEAVLKKSAIGRWSSNSYFLILFSNCLFLAETDLEYQKFKIVERPIPIELVTCEIPKALEFDNSETKLRASVEPERKIHDSLKLVHNGQRTTWTVKFNSTNSRTLWMGHIKAAVAASLKSKTNKFKFNAVVTDIQAAGCLNSLAAHPATLPIVRASNNYVQYSICPPAVKKISCATTVVYGDKLYYLIGTASGLYVRTDFDRWEKLPKFSNVSQMEYVPDAELLLLMSDKKFLQLNIEHVVTYFHAGAGSVPSVKLSNQNVEFFGSGYIDGVFMILYMKVKLTTSAIPYKSFKALSLDDKRRTFKANSLFDKFFLAVDCYGCTMFNNSVVLKTSKGFLMLDHTLAPTSIPKTLDMKLPNNFQSKEAEFFKIVEHRVAIEKPIASFAVHNGNEILLVFSTFAVFCNERGFLSRVKLLESNLKCTGAAMKGSSLYLLSKNAIEVFDLVDSGSVLYPTGFITGDTLEIVNTDSINQGNFLFLASNPNGAGKMLLEVAE